MNDIMPLPMPPSMNHTVMSSPAVHPAEIAAETQVQSDVVEEATVQSDVVEEETVQSDVVEEATVQSDVVEEETLQSDVVEEAVVQEPEQIDDIDFVFNVCNNVKTFINTNNEKIKTLNNVVEQLYNLGLSDNSAIEHLNNQQLKYTDILVKIKSSFVDINEITNFIL